MMSEPRQPSISPKTRSIRSSWAYVSFISSWISDAFMDVPLFVSDFSLILLSYNVFRIGAIDFCRGIGSGGKPPPLFVVPEYPCALAAAEYAVGPVRERLHLIFSRIELHGGDKTDTAFDLVREHL